jgi:hypothetical protein
MGHKRYARSFPQAGNKAVGKSAYSRPTVRTVIGASARHMVSSSKEPGENQCCDDPSFEDFSETIVFAGLALARGAFAPCHPV